MTSKQLMQRLALERCRLSLSHICALNHLGDDCKIGENLGASTAHLVEGLHRDLALMEMLLLED